MATKREPPPGAKQRIRRRLAGSGGAERWSLEAEVDKRGGSIVPHTLVRVEKRAFARAILACRIRNLQPAARQWLRTTLAEFPAEIAVEENWRPRLASIRTLGTLRRFLREVWSALEQPDRATVLKRPPANYRIKVFVNHVDSETRRDVAGMLSASLAAFWQLAQQLKWTIPEQAALLAVSESTCLRWRREPPVRDVNVLDRLQVILLAYQSMSELAPVEQDEVARLFRVPGSAADPDDPEMSLLTALTTPSILEMDARYRRFAALAHAS